MKNHVDDVCGEVRSANGPREMTLLMIPRKLTVRHLLDRWRLADGVANIAISEDEVWPADQDQLNQGQNGDYIILLSRKYIHDIY